MSILSPTNLETCDYGTAGWNAIYSSNFQKLNTYLAKFEDLWNTTPSDWNILRYSSSSNKWIKDTIANLSTQLATYLAKIDLSNVSDSTILTKLLNVDGSGSGLDSDKVDGYDASQTPTASTIPVAKSDGKLDGGWIAQGSGSGLDSDKVDGYHASLTPAASTIPVASSRGSFLVSGWAETNAGITIYVDNVNGSDTTGDGSSTNPYASLSKALSELPPKIAHSVTIVLKKTANSYGSIYLAGFVMEQNGSLTIQGEFDTLDSGTVGSFSNSENDPVYGSLVQVAKITDSSKNWTTNQYQHKLVRVYKGSTSYYRTICYNDSTSIYTNQTFPVTIDNTWSYEILDWGTKCEYIQMDYNAGAINIQNLKIERTINSYAIVPRKTMVINIDNCFIVGYPNGSYATVLTGETYCTINNSIIDANNTTSYAFWVSTGNVAFFLQLTGVLVLNNSSSAIYNNYSFTRINVTNGTRFYKGSSNPTYGINMFGGMLIGGVTYGKVLIDAGSTAGISLTRGAFVQNTSAFVFGSNVTQKYYAYWGMLDGAKLNVYDYFGVNITNHNYENVHSRILCYGSFATRVHTVTANTTLGVDHHIVLVDASGGARTITLPDATTCAGRQYIIKKIDSSANAVTISAQTGQSIDGSASINITTQYDVKRVVSDGTNWYIF